MRDQISRTKPSLGPCSHLGTFLTRMCECRGGGAAVSQGHGGRGTLGSGPVGPWPLVLRFLALGL